MSQLATLPTNVKWPLSDVHPTIYTYSNYSSLDRESRDVPASHSDDVAQSEDGAQPGERRGGKRLR
jgi:hypothetical protein